METTPLQRFANTIGFVAYNFAVGGGLPDRELLAAAMQDPAGRPAQSTPSPAPQARPIEPTAHRSAA
ncbi:MAG: hypothetical protein WEE64_09075 [Dehalococcoidia bacterium]